MPRPDGPQFRYVFRPDIRQHTLMAYDDKGSMGNMEWTDHDGEITHLFVGEARRGEGIATSLWEKANRIAATSDSIPVPQHSEDRTDDGDAWAHSVSDEWDIPPRSDRFNYE